MTKKYESQQQINSDLKNLADAARKVETALDFVRPLYQALEAGLASLRSNEEVIQEYREMLSERGLIPKELR